jgi:hypothetical protein
MRTDDDLTPLVNKRVRLTLDDGTFGEGVLWRDEDGGRVLYQLAPSGPDKANFVAHGIPFSAAQVEQIEAF